MDKQYEIVFLETDYQSLTTPEDFQAEVERQLPNYVEQYAAGGANAAWEIAHEACKKANLSPPNKAAFIQSKTLELKRKLDKNKAMRVILGKLEAEKAKRT